MILLKYYAPCYAIHPTPPEIPILCVTIGNCGYATLPHVSMRLVLVEPTSARGSLPYAGSTLLDVLRFHAFLL